MASPDAFKKAAMVFGLIAASLAPTFVGAAALAWLAAHPDWDPRVRLAPASQQQYLHAKIAREAAAPPLATG